MSLDRKILDECADLLISFEPSKENVYFDNLFKKVRTEGYDIFVREELGKYRIEFYNTRNKSRYATIREIKK